MLSALKQVIWDYTVPPQASLSRTLEGHLKQHINHLSASRPLSISMRNTIRHLKNEIAHIPPDLDNQQAKDHICGVIDAYQSDKIEYADKLIIQHALSKIEDDDVIMIYARSDVILQILLQAHARGTRFRVVLVDSRPKLDGQSTCETLINGGLDVTYVFINSIGYMMNSVTKVFLGANGIYLNGTLLSRLGTHLIAMTAHYCKVPVIVCCETYKFTDQAQLVTRFGLELRETSAMKPPPHSEAGRLRIYESESKSASPQLVDVVHDMTPPEYIDMIVTEIGMIPCTSVPVVLREYCCFPI